MGIVYRHQKENPLTIEEMDGNFAHLEQRIKSLELNQGLVEGVSNLTQEGDQVTLYGTLGTQLGQIILPKAFPNFRNIWLSKTRYRVLDWVQFQQSLYSCIEAHTSTEFEDDKIFWALVFQQQ